MDNDRCSTELRGRYAKRKVVKRGREECRVTDRDKLIGTKRD